MTVAGCSYPRGPSLISPMTEKAIEYRRQVLDQRHAAHQASLGWDHWSNTPSGQELFDEFKSKFPNVVSPDFEKRNQTNLNVTYQRPHSNVTPKTSMFEGTAFDPNYREYRIQQYQQQFCGPAHATRDVASVVIDCKIKVARRHVEAAADLLSAY